MPQTCINLKKRFSDLWRVEYEANLCERARIEDPWGMIIPCRHGHICPWGGGRLAACTAKRGMVATRLANLLFTDLEQDGQDGVNVSFPADLIDQVAEIMRPKRKRPPQTEAQQRAAVENLARGKAYQFTAKNRPKSTLESHGAALVVSEHV